VPSAKQIRKFIRDTITILFEFRALVGELVFTVAALYGFYRMLLAITQ
jgi:hypothetical protein